MSDLTLNADELELLLRVLEVYEYPELGVARACSGNALREAQERLKDKLQLQKALYNKLYNHRKTIQNLIPTTRTPDLLDTLRASVVNAAKHYYNARHRNYSVKSLEVTEQHLIDVVEVLSNYETVLQKRKPTDG
jgi:hypothetical protein